MPTFPPSRKQQETPSAASSPSLSSAATTDTEATAADEQEPLALGAVAETPEEVMPLQEDVAGRWGGMGVMEEPEHLPRGYWQLGQPQLPRIQPFPGGNSSLGPTCPGDQGGFFPPAPPSLGAALAPTALRPTPRSFPGQCRPQPAGGG